MELIAWMPWDGDGPGLTLVLELAMASGLAGKIPAVRVQLFQEIANFHVRFYLTGCSDIRGARPSVDLRKKRPAGQYSESLLSLWAIWGGGESGT